jgi:hypothetical protein
MTTLEASRLLAFRSTSGGVIDALRRGAVEEIKGDGAGSGRFGRCLWRRDQVEALAKEREHVAWLKANGFKFCNGCSDWKDRASQFAPSAHRCRECMRKVNKATWAAQKRQRSRSTLSVESYVGQGRPAEPQDALKYACMDVGFHHRPLPMCDGRRMSKREAYCQHCTARRCVHYKDVTPKELVTQWKRWGR